MASSGAGEQDSFLHFCKEIEARTCTKYAGGDKSQGRITLNTGGCGFMQIFGVLNLTLSQYFGYVNNNIEKIQYLESENLKKGRIVQFGVIFY